MKKKVIENQEVSFIVGEPSITGTSVQLHSKESRIVKKVSEVKEDYDTIINQITFIISDTTKTVEETGFKLDEVKLSLGFNAKGKIAFIAEAGIEASIEVVFKRK